MAIKQAGRDEIYKIYTEQPADTVWIDVRQPEEWAEGTIPGIQRIMLAELPERLGELDKQKTYVMVCRSGGRSGRATQAME
ncbi:MAG: rhodanese, partial [Candidatus Melainabacteria bacterium HGW-Melainabacteria-1]